MVRRFTNLNQIQRYIEDNVSILKSKELEKLLAKEMSKAVHEVVYKQYTPKVYERREDSGGLSDTRNMHITSVKIVNGKVQLLFENLTMGQNNFIPIYEYNVDSLNGEFITDTIVDGIRDNWYHPDSTDDMGRVVSERRDFIDATIKNIKNNPKPLIDAIKECYKRLGFKIK